MSDLSTDFSLVYPTDAWTDPTTDPSLVGPAQGPTLDELGLASDPISGASTTNGGGGLGSFFSSLASDASSLIGGYVSTLTQKQILQRNQQLQQYGYTVPLNTPGLNGALPTSTILLFMAVIFVLIIFAGK